MHRGPLLVVVLLVAGCGSGSDSEEELREAWEASRTAVAEGDAAASCRLGSAPALTQLRRSAAGAGATCEQAARRILGDPEIRRRARADRLLRVTVEGEAGRTISADAEYPSLEWVRVDGRWRTAPSR